MAAQSEDSGNKAAPGLDELKRDLLGLLDFYRMMGVEGYVLPRKSTREAQTGKAAPPGPKKGVKLDLSVSTRILEAIAPGGDLRALEAEIGADCTRCKLCEERNSVVFGEGSPNARIVFVGEGPGADEDAQGKPFVGRAGKLLGRIIGAMGFERPDVYICNVVKCRPPGNRNPEPDEMDTCGAFMFRQLRAIDPEVVICLGSVAAHYLLQLGRKVSLGSLRGAVHELGPMKVVVTYHPAALLRSPGYRKPLWEDMKLALSAIGLKPPPPPPPASG